MTKEKEKLLQEAHKKYFQLMLHDLSLEQIHDIVTDDVSGYGSTMDEKIHEIGRLKKMIIDQRVQGEGIEMHSKLKPVNLRISPENDMAIFNDEVKITMQIEDTEHVINLRLTTIYEFINNNWKVVHLHASTAVNTENDTWHLDEWKKQNKILRKQVEEKTAELQKKNRELEIEAALERVRSVAMSMQKPDDLLEVCRIISDQLESLNVKNIRNVQVAIINESNRTYANYQYFTAYAKTAYEETGYENNPASQALVTEMQKSANSFFIGSIRGKDLEEFRDWRKKYNQLPDPLLEDHAVIFHYFYSIGQGGLGLTTYEEISNESLEIFKRFHKVFTLAYRRFMDIRHAAAQAREAEIQLSLERVRARTMAMQHSDELPETASLMSAQLKGLGEEIDQVTIGIFKEKTNVVEAFGTVKGDQFQTLEVSVDESFMMGKAYRAWKAGEKSSTIKLSGEKLISYNKWRNSFFHKNIYPVDNPDGTWFANAAFFSKGFLGFSSEKQVSNQANELLQRFAAVFDLTYTRFLDLKKAEEQAREAQIETALERIRSASMAMHKSEELQNVVEVMYDQIVPLGLSEVGISVMLFHPETSSIEYWFADYLNYDHVTSYFIESRNHHIMEQLWDYWEKQEVGLTIHIENEEKREWDRFLFTETGFKKLPSELKKDIESSNSVWFSYASMRFGLLEAVDEKPPKEENVKILQRVAGVFEQAYTRFLDLKRSEAQTREAQIEAALERVRSRSMAMQNSEELADLSFELVKQVSVLGINTWFCAFNIYDDDPRGSLEWGSNMNGTYEAYRTPREGIFLRYYQAGQSGETLLINEIGKDECPAHYDYLCSLPGVGEQLLKMKDAGIPFPVSQIDHVAYFKYGYIIFITFEPVPTAHDTFKRFAKVFEQTYTRFLDLTAAEAQARESALELSLERIRSQVTAMQESSELFDIVVNMRNEFVGLGHEADYFWHMRWLPDVYKMWMTSDDGSRIGTVISIPKYGHENIPGLAEWEKGDGPVYVLPLDANGAWDYIENMNTGHYEKVDPNAPTREDIQHIGGLTFIMARTTHGEIGFGLPGYVADPPQESLDTLVRFAGVFDLAYRRFEDLKSAERQNRETQIELSLERVRSQAMAMQHSDDLTTSTAILFEELDKLDLSIDRCGIGIFEEETRDCHLWTTVVNEDGKTKLTTGITSLTIHPMLVKTFDAWKSMGSLQYTLEGQELEDYYRMVSKSRFQLPKETVDHSTSLTREYYLYTPFGAGGLYVFSATEPSEEEKNILRRFADVFNMTYTRYEDLQKAEARALEAIKQSSLDRIRGQIASMRNTDDLQQITPLIWNELTALDVPFFRCGVFIVDEKQHHVKVYLTTPEGKSLASLDLDFDLSDLIRITVDSWRKKEVYLTHWSKEEFIAWTAEMMKIRQVENPEKYQGSETPPESLHLHFIPFTQGMLYVGNSGQLSNEQLDLVKSLAEAFSFAYSRYEDFVVLEEAKQRVEKALNDLKATQTQLVHAEKMASLGELTAGIAHEIQNPLNFVNNFSEVSADLIKELKEELQHGDTEEVNAIATDLLGNLDKINHHGNRASGIVKSMLEHSRTGSGEKQPTDINTLADEYLRLAYHGLRAKDKTFNADFKTDFDLEIPKVRMLSQDIGRVLLNLINNAFHAVSQHNLSVLNDEKPFKPTVIVSSKNLGDKIEIRVQDNGNGIPVEIKEKIFQPFFTTKPTGQGTGLGLSMSYDIITKGHGGKLDFESKPGEGTTFIIHLPVDNK